MTVFTQKQFVRYSWFTVFYLMLVIAWGAIVRVSGSGAGCGAHWPKCNGDIVPLAPSAQTLIEYGHRLTSGLSVLLVVGLWIVARRLYRKGHVIRLWVSLTLLFLVLEAGIGAAIVLNEWVLNNSSVARAVTGALHLANTFFLLASAGIVAYLSRFKELLHFDRRLRFIERKQFVYICILFLLVGMSGAIVALGDTLFPADSLIDGLKQDFSSSSHFLIRLRVLHPLFALVTAVFLIAFSRVMGRKRFYVGRSTDWLQLQQLVYVQLAVGVLNWLLMAPAWLQIVHLVLADLIWLRFITLGLSLFIVPGPLSADEAVRSSSVYLHNFTSRENES